MAKSLKIALAQLNCLVGDAAGNAEKILQAAHHARDTLQADILVTPELAICGYPPEDLLFRPKFQRHIQEANEYLQKNLTGIALIVGTVDTSMQAIYNAALFIADGKIVAKYRKSHLPNYSVFDEERYFTADSHPCVVEYKGMALGITICEDLWQAGPMQRSVEAGANVMICLNASPFDTQKHQLREDRLRERIKEESIPILYTNCVGGQDELVFDGQSFCMDAKGSVTHRSHAFVEETMLVELQTGNHVRIQPPKELVETASIETQIYQALTLGLKDYIEKNNFPGVIIGLSGGIDSALTLAIAVDAIGNENVHAVLMPSRFTADMSVEDAKTEADHLGVIYSVISIDKTYQSFLDTLSKEFKGLPADVTEENIQARCRGILLMALSNKKGKLVLTTGNKSEMAVGYATLYGDMAGGFSVLKDIPKTLVYQLVNYRNSISAIIPQRVIDRPPSAELAEEQKDEDTLPPYSTLDAILELYVEYDRSIEDITAHGFSKEIVKKVVAMVNHSEYKRRQAPPGIKVSQKAFGRDRRYPITSGFRKEK